MRGEKERMRIHASFRLKKRISELRGAEAKVRGEKGDEKEYSGAGYRRKKRSHVSRREVNVNSLRGAATKVAYKKSRGGGGGGGIRKGEISNFKALRRRT